MFLFFSGAQARSIYLCRTPVAWRCQGSFLWVESWSIPRVRELLQGTGNAYGQELSSVLLCLNPAKNLLSSSCRFCFGLQSHLACCTLSWLTERGRYFVTRHMHKDLRIWCSLFCFEEKIMGEIACSQCQKYYPSHATEWDYHWERQNSSGVYQPIRPLQKCDVFTGVKFSKVSKMPYWSSVTTSLFFFCWKAETRK